MMCALLTVCCWLSRSRGVGYDEMKLCASRCAFGHPPTQLRSRSDPTQDHHRAAHALAWPAALTDMHVTTKPRRGVVIATGDFALDQRHGMVIDPQPQRVMRQPRLKCRHRSLPEGRRVRLGLVRALHTILRLPETTTRILAAPRVARLRGGAHCGKRR